MKALLFPGQGSQRAGMGAELFDRFPDMVAEADAILGYGIRDLCLQNSGGRLDRTEITQPAVYVVAALRYHALESEAAPEMMAGHSLGEYVALYAAGSFGFADGLHMVQERGRLMGEIAGGGLVALIGFDVTQIERLIAEDGLEGVEIANINSPEQIVLGGRKGRLQNLLEACRKRGIRAVPLRVSGAFHTSEMKPAAERFAAFLSDFSFAAPRSAVLSNVTGKPHEPSEIRKRLIEQIARPVQWSRSVETMLQTGVTDFVELGSPPILMPMVSVIRRHLEGGAEPAPLPEAQREPSTAQTPSQNAPEQTTARNQDSGDFGDATLRSVLARRHDLDGDTKRALADGEGYFETLPDWHFPELASTSLGFARHKVIAAATRALQTCYGSPEVSSRRIAEIGARLPDPFCSRLRNLAAELESDADIRTRRAAIRSAAKDIFFPGIVLCDGPQTPPQSNGTTRQTMENHDG